MQPAQYLRRKEAGQYLRDKFGFGSYGTLAKLATVGGGPEYCYIGTIPVYLPAKLDEWALSKLSQPVRSTSDPEALPFRGRTGPKAAARQVEPANT
jgi:hypothetical protein